MAKDTYCVVRTDTHVNNKQTCVHTHTTSASVGIECLSCVRQSVCDSQRHICVSMITKSAFVSVVSQEHTLS